MRKQEGLHKTAASPLTQRQKPQRKSNSKTQHARGSGGRMRVLRDAYYERGSAASCIKTVVINTTASLTIQQLGQEERSVLQGLMARLYPTSMHLGEGPPAQGQEVPDAAPTACEAIISLMLCSYCSARMASFLVCSSFRLFKIVLCSLFGVTSSW